MARGKATMRLATCGTLMPGKPNHHERSALEGSWLDGTVRGNVLNDGWGAALGYPGLILDEHGPDVQVPDVQAKVLESADLPAHWPRLDAFEGPGYRRVVVPVRTAEELLDACILCARDAAARCPRTLALGTGRPASAQGNVACQRSFRLQTTTRIEG